MEREQNPAFVAPGDASEEAEVSFEPSAAQRPQSRIAGVVERSRADLLKIEGVHGVSEGRTPTGDDAVRVDIEDDSVRERLPTAIDGYPLEVVVVAGGFGILPAESPYSG